MAAYEDSIIVKRIKKAKHAHHGGAWKIAYADFVTAMMAFFLLLWLISMTTDEQKKGLADYFSPPNVSESNSGAGGVMGGQAFDETGARTESYASEAMRDVNVAPDNAERGELNEDIGGINGAGGGRYEENRASQNELRSRMDQDFHGAAASIRQAWQAMPNITEMSQNLMVQETEEGLNIVIADQEGRPMFPEGSKYPTEEARQAIAAIAPTLNKLPNQVEISGHTAAGGSYPNPRYGAWELSSDRANVVRGILGEFGLSNDRVLGVTGRASTEPLFPNDPYLSGNERIVITLLYDAPPVPPSLKP